MSRSFLLSLSALCLIMTLPLWIILALKWPISSDLVFYAASIKAFSAQFWEGDLYPRWLLNTNAGFGSPVFVFYSPLPYYAMSLFEFLSPVDTHGFGRVFIGIMMAVLVAGITSYRWLAKQTDRQTAEKGALLYAGFPYLLLHMYGGFSVGQLWGIALLPLLMDVAYDVAKKGWQSLPKLSLAYALLCTTHLPTMLMFAAVPCLYVMVFAPRGKRLFLGMLSGCFALLGISLAAVYLLPALLNKNYIATEHFLDANLVYANDFLDTYSQLGIVSVVLPLLVLYFELSKQARKTLMSSNIRFWIAVVAVFLFMAMPLSKPIWDAIPALQHLQFPFRFFLVMLPGAVFIAVHFLPYARSRTLYKGLFAVGLACAAIYSSEIAFFARETPVAVILKHNLLARPEYQTRWMEKENIDFRTHVPERFLAMKSATLTEGKGSASIIEQGSRSILLHTDITSPEATVVLQRFYFPGWEANPRSIAVSQRDALLSITAPKGSRTISLTLAWFAGEREGMIISIGAFITLWTLYTFSRLQASPARRISNA